MIDDVIRRTPFFLLLAPVFLLSCREEKEGQSSEASSKAEMTGPAETVEPSPEPVLTEAETFRSVRPKVPNDHEDVIEELMELQKKLVVALGNMVETGSVDEFRGELDQTKLRMKVLLEKATGLPKPGKEEKTFYDLAGSSFADLNLEMMDRVISKVRKSPEDGAVRKAFHALSTDTEMGDLKRDFDLLYR